jgi:hypothetical protein
MFRLRDVNVTNLKELSHFREAASRSATQEYPEVLR